jgi:AraC-like DNA-binding protein
MSANLNNKYSYSESPYSMDAPQRLSLLSGIPALLADFGVPFARAIEGLPVEAKVFDDPDQRIPYSLASLVLGRAAELSGCAHFGLILGSRYDHLILGVPGQWMQNAPNLESALDGFVSLQQGNSRGAAAYLHRQGMTVVFGYGVYDHRANAHEQIYSMIMALAVNIVRALTQGAAKVSEVLLSIRPPADKVPYEYYFGVPVRFGQPESGLVLPRSALAAPVIGAKPEESERLRQLAASMAPPSVRPWTDRVKHALRPMILRGKTTSVEAAKLLGLSVRSLSRRLAEEGTTFQRALDEIRFAMARELLSVTNLPVGDIAHTLSYAAHAPFVHSFRRWSGMTPSEWRESTRTG